MTLLPDHWATLIDAIRSGAVRRLTFDDVDFSTLADNAFQAAVACRGLQSFKVRWSFLPSGFVADDLIRISVARGFLRLKLFENQCDIPQNISDDAVLDFFFRVDAPVGGQSRSLSLAGTGLTDMFLKKFFDVSTWLYESVCG